MANSKTPTNDELLRRCRDGDDRAWRVLVERFGSLILSVPRRYGLSPAQVDDVFSDVCLALVNSLRTIRDPDRLPGWIVRTTTRCTWRVARQQKAHEAPPVWREAGPEPIAIAEQLETEQIVRDAVARLPARCRELLERLYFSEATPSYDDLAKIIGVPRGSLGPTRKRCLARMREHLEPLVAELSIEPTSLECDTHA